MDDTAEPAVHPAEAPSRPHPLLVPLLLALLVAAVYGRTAWYGFVSMDDGRYVYGNPAVAGGLSAGGAAWAFGAVRESAYMPLTWLSHMADVSLFGLSGGGHHLVNVLLHGANAILLYLLLAGATRSAWRSALVAALFAAHPLNVETVAWVSERKELLSAFFSFLAIHAYLRHVRAPSGRSILPVALLHGAALLSKAMAVTLPFTLLLLDLWPLRRWSPRAPGGAPPGEGEGAPAGVPLRTLLLEKAPLFALSAAMAAFMLLARGGSFSAAAPTSPRLVERLATMAVAPALYLRRIAWPDRLSVFYPHPATLGEQYPGWLVAGSVALAAALVFLAVLQARRRPFLLTGWLWFLVTLVPVAGLVQISLHSIADRYAYLTSVGIFLAAAWLLPGGAAIPLPAGALGVPQPGARRRTVPAAAALAVLAVGALAVRAHGQVRVWRDDVSLYEAAVKADPRGWFAWNNLGAAYLERGDAARAAEAFRYVLSVQPGFTRAWMGLGRALATMGREEEAARAFRSLVYLEPGAPDGWHNLAVASWRTGRREEAEEALRRLAAIDPSRAAALARTLEAGGDAPPGATPTPSGPR